MALLSACSLYGLNPSAYDIFNRTLFFPDNKVFCLRMSDSVCCHSEAFLEPSNNPERSSDTAPNKSSSFTIDSILARSPKPQTPTRRSEIEARVESEAVQNTLEDPRMRFSWLHCTRYKPPKLPRVKRKEGPQKRKLGRNPRIPFSPAQVAALDQKFRSTHYLSSMDVAELSASLNLSETRVKIWFQNRRARERRGKVNHSNILTTQSSTPPAAGISPNSSSTSTSSATLMAHLASSCSESHGLQTASRYSVIAPSMPDAATLAQFTMALQQGNSAFTPMGAFTYRPTSHAE